MLVRPPKPASRPSRRRAQLAAAMSRYRRRQAAGAMTVPVEIDGAVVDLLVRMRWLSEADAGDRAAIGRAIGRMLADSARG